MIAGIQSLVMKFKDSSDILHGEFKIAPVKGGESSFLSLSTAAPATSSNRNSFASPPTTAVNSNRSSLLLPPVTSTPSSQSPILRAPTDK